MKTRLILAALAMGTAAIVSIGTAAAGCKEGFCVTGFDKGNIHYVSFTSTYSNVHHYNARSAGMDGDENFGGNHQREVGRNVRNFSFYGGSPGSKVSYSIQACNKGALTGSSCAPWVTFTHTMK
jgi:hypothetical protein